MSAVNMKSTKQEIFDALQEAQKALKQRQSLIENPGEATKKAEEKKVIEMAAEDVKQNIFSEEINQKYENLTNAIALLEAKLKEQYQVEDALLSLVNVINAQKQAQIKLEEEFEQRKGEINTQLENAKREAKETENALKAQNTQLQEELKTARQRENEEYEYNLKRSRKLAQDEYDDKKAMAEKELLDIQAMAEKIKTEAQEKAAEIVEMSDKIEKFPSQLEEKYQAGYADGEKAAGKEYGYKKSMSDKEHEYELKERDSRIGRLENELAEKTEKIASLENKLDAAYSQLRDLATKTVESNGSIKVIGNSGDNGSSKRQMLI